VDLIFPFHLSEEKKKGEGEESKYVSRTPAQHAPFAQKRALGGIKRVRKNRGRFIIIELEGGKKKGGERGRGGGSIDLPSSNH